MVWSVIQNFKLALRYRGGWRGLLEHMYTNGDYPFKFGTFMGADKMGNRYYENRVDYPLGQHRWVEPADIHNFDASHVPPEWHGWMTSMNDATPYTEAEFIAEKKKDFRRVELSHAPFQDNLGHQEPYFNFNHMHNQSQIRSRGYGIGNNVVGLPPGAPDAFYTQPGSPYNDAQLRRDPMVGSLDADGGRAYKSEMWKERLKTPQEKQTEKQAELDSWKQAYEKTTKRLSAKELAVLARGGTINQ